MLTYEGRTEGFNGQASPLGFSEWACLFRWARLFLGPDEWACEPYFSNPINCPPALVYGVRGQGL